MKDIERDAYKDLVYWKEHDNRVLLVEGARQVGKTYLVKKFVKESFPSTIYIDMSDDSGERFLSILEKYIGLGDEEKLLLTTLKEYNKDFNNVKDTIVVIDEIQESHLVYNKIRSFNRLMNCRFIVTGSYLGRTTLSNKFWESAGDFSSITIVPLTFREFLGAVNESLTKIFDNIDLYGGSPKEQYKSLKEFYIVYTIIGGYPALVNEFLESKKLENVYKLDEKLLEIFSTESARYLKAEEYIILIRRSFNYFARLLLKEKKGLHNNNPSEELIKLNTNLTYKEGSLNFNKVQYTKVLSWLITNKSLYSCDKVINCDLLNVENDQRFYFNDLGILNYLLVSMEIEEGISKGILNENYVCIVLKNKNLMTNFGTFANYEIDFLIKDSEYIYGIEVKSGKDSGKSVKMAYKKGMINKILYLKGDTFGGIEGDIITIPIYLFERFKFKPSREKNLQNLEIFQSFK